MVVWQDDGGRNSEVRYLDLAGSERPVADTGGLAPPERAPRSPAGGSSQQQVNGNWDIDMKDRDAS
jgi:hypothetical protein